PGSDIGPLLDPLPVLPYRSQCLETFQGGARTVALVAVGSNLLMARRFAFLVEQQLAGCQRHDLLVKQTRLLRRSGTLLALQRVLVLGGTADAITLGNNFRSLDHRDVGRRRHLHHGFGTGAVAVLV